MTKQPTNLEEDAELIRQLDDVLDSYYPSGWNGNMRDDLLHLIAANKRKAVEEAENTKLAEVYELLKSCNSMFEVGILEGTIRAVIENPGDLTLEAKQ